jgi:hypothetical protein
MKRMFVVLSLIIAMAASLVAVSSANAGAAFQAGRKKSERSLEDQRLTSTQQQALEGLGQGVGVELNDQGIPSYLTGKLSARLHKDDPVAEANGALETFGQAFRVGPDDGFIYSDMRPDRTGGAYVRMAQTYKGIPVVGGELTVRLSKDEVLGIKGNFIPDLDLDTRPALAKKQARAIVESQKAEGIGAKGSVEEAGEPVIYVNEKGVARLAIPVRVEQAKTARSEEVFVDALDSIVLGSRPAKVKKQGGDFVTLVGPGNPNLLKDPGFECGPQGFACGLSASDWTVLSTLDFRYKNPPFNTILDTNYVPPPARWFPSDGDIIFPGDPVHTGTYKAWLGGWGSIRQDSVSQCITIPQLVLDISGKSSRASLSLWINIATDEIPGDGRRPPTGTDYMFVEILDCNDNLKGVLGYYSSFYPASPFIQQSGDISQFQGQTIKIRFRSFENGSRQTSFFIDDLAVRTFFDQDPF